ncbi:MAG: phosphoglycolate phosphatase [Clostridia bacterium]|jgi:HAD superfamily hydrolase (TIGR01509 family)|nr:phosphoglycolate phosphatase [Clostridia bacterium]
MIRAAIFDMDGLMFDTEHLAFEGWMKAAKELNYPITPEVIALLRGRNIKASKALFEELFGNNVDYDKARQIRTTYVIETIEKSGIPIKTGLLEMLSYLKQKQIKMAVATSTHKEQAIRFLELAGVTRYFDFCICGDMVTSGKPDPEIFLKAAEILDQKPENCVIFEDSPAGVEAGWQAGSKVVLIPDLTEPTQETVEMAAIVCKDLVEAIAVIELWK